MSETAASPEGRRARVASVALAVIVVLAHLPFALEPHVEGDEAVLLFLAARLARAPAEYHVRGALDGPAARRFVAETAPAAAPDRAPAPFALDRVELLRASDGTPRYDPAIYARPMFFHPPLYPYALALARSIGRAAGPALLSATMHGATVGLTGILGATLGGSTVGVLAALLVAIDPISWLCGSRAWIDATLAALCTAAVLAAVRAAAIGSTRPAAAAGLVLGAACLAKLTAALALPGIAVVALVTRPRVRARAVAAYTAGVAVCVGPWLALARIVNGEWLPATFPTAWQIEHYPYVAQAVARPTHFYATGLALVAPVLALAPLALLRLRREPWLWVPLTWAAGFGVPLTALGAAGLGFQLRYLAPAVPALCLLAAAAIAALGRWRWLVLPLAGATALSGVAASAPGAPEPIPYAIERSLAAAGIDLRATWPRLWRSPAQR